MTGTIGILHTVKPSGKHVLGSHINGFLVGTGAGIGIYLGIKDGLPILVVGHAKDGCFCLLHIIGGCLNQGLQFSVIEPEKLCRDALTDFLSRKTFPDGIEYLDFLLHITALPGYPYQLPHFFVEVLESALKAFLVVPLVLLQGFQLFGLPHGPLNAFLRFLGPVSVHVANHGGNQLILYGFEGGADIVLCQRHHLPFACTLNPCALNCRVRLLSCVTLLHLSQRRSAYPCFSMAYIPNGTCSLATCSSPWYSFWFIWYRRFITLTFICLSSPHV